MSLLEKAASKIGTKVENVAVVKVGDSPYEGRNHRVTNLHTGSIVYLNLDDDDEATATVEPEPDPISIDEELEDKTVTELKGIARRLELPVGGSKAKLIERIKEKLDE